MPIGWNQDHYDVLEDGVVVGRIFLMPIGPRGRPWMWASGHNRAIERAVHGYEPTRLRWRRSPGAGDGNRRRMGANLSGKLSGLMFQTVLSVGRSGRI